MRADQGMQVSRQFFSLMPHFWTLGLLPSKEREVDMRKTAKTKILNAKITFAVWFEVIIAFETETRDKKPTWAQIQRMA